MSITFRCEKCHKDVKANDSAAGQRGKCPFCGQSSYIPAPVSEEELIPLSPLDEESDGQQKEAETFWAQDRELLHEMGGEVQAPLEHKEDLRAEDLYHFVVNYCLDMFNGQLDRVPQHVQKLKQYKYTAIDAVKDFESGKAMEIVLDVIPKKVLKKYLSDLREQLG